MEYLLCCRTRLRGSEKGDHPEQVVNLLRKHGATDLRGTGDEMEYDSQDDAAEERQRAKKRYDAHRNETRSLMAKLDEKEKGLMERIATAEAIVAKELERMQRKTTEEDDFDTPWERKVIEAATEPDGQMGLAGGVRGEPIETVGVPAQLAAAAAEAAGAAKTAASADQISITPQKEITEKEEPLAAAEATADEAALEVLRTTVASAPDSTADHCPTPASSLENKQESGIARQDVLDKVKIDIEDKPFIVGTATVDHPQVTPKTEASCSYMEPPTEILPKEAVEKQPPKDHPTSHGDLAAAFDLPSGTNHVDVQEQETFGNVKREFSASLCSLQSDSSTLTSTSLEDIRSDVEDASESSPSVTQLKSATSDLDLRLSASSENEGEASGSKDSAQQLADYLKWRDQASDLSLSDEGSIKMNGVHSNESVDLTNVEENCEMPAIPEDEMAEATVIVVERAVVDEGDTKLAVNSSSNGGDDKEEPNPEEVVKLSLRQ